MAVKACVPGVPDSSSKYLLLHNICDQYITCDWLLLVLELFFFYNFCPVFSVLYTTWDFSDKFQHLNFRTILVGSYVLTKGQQNGLNLPTKNTIQHISHQMLAYNETYVVKIFCHYLLIKIIF